MKQKQPRWIMAVSDARKRLQRHFSIESPMDLITHSRNAYDRFACVEIVNDSHLERQQKAVTLSLFLVDPDVNVRRLAISFLGRTRTDHAVSALAAQMQWDSQNPSYIRRSLVWLLPLSCGALHSIKKWA
jgi:hypothetical protein